ncbi:unnamed protein product, partial [Amoebophrya sp. A25]
KTALLELLLSNDETVAQILRKENSTAPQWAQIFRAVSQQPRCNKAKESTDVGESRTRGATFYKIGDLEIL